jgi:hypothetical protein
MATLTPVVGLHIPKCGGMAMIEHARAHLAANKFLELSNAIAPFSTNRFVTWYDVPDPWRLSLIFGHFVHEEMIKYFENGSFLFTVIRNPIDRLESQFFFDRRIAKTVYQKELELEKFLKYKGNGICKFLIERFPTIASVYGGDISAAAICILNMFDRVYLHEKLSDQIPEICELLSIPPKLPASNLREQGLELTPAQREMVAQHCTADLEVYAAIRSSFGNSAARLRRGSHEALVTERSRLLGTAHSETVLNNFLANYTLAEFRQWSKLDKYRAFRERQFRAIADELKLFDLQRRQIWGGNT